MAFIEANKTIFLEGESTTMVQQEGIFFSNSDMKKLDFQK